MSLQRPAGLDSSPERCQFGIGGHLTGEIGHEGGGVLRPVEGEELADGEFCAEGLFDVRLVCGNRLGKSAEKVRELHVLPRHMLECDVKAHEPN